MDPIDYTKYYRVFNMPENSSLHELDERYFECVEYWTIQDRHGVDAAKSELKLIDEAYGILLRKVMRNEWEAGSPRRSTFTMQQVVNGQERITNTSANDKAHWLPPREPSSLSPEPDTDDIDMDLDDDLETTWRSVLERDTGTTPGFKIREIEGNIKDAPDRAVVVHAVNCQGVWGFGVAKELKTMCPAAFEVYRSHCKRAARPYDLIGTCLLVPPQQKDYEHGCKIKLKAIDKTIQSDISITKPRRWIACLFTSIGYGRPNMRLNNPGKNSPPSILTFTRVALEELRTRLEDFGPSNFNKMTNKATDDEKPGEVWSPKFNSGAFGVDWESTRNMIVEEFEGFERPWVLVHKNDGEDYEPSKNEKIKEQESNTGRPRRHSQTDFEDRTRDRREKSKTPLRDFLMEERFIL